MKKIKRRPFKKQTVSRDIRNTHAIVTVDGTEQDFERMKKILGAAARKYNHSSENKMSYEIRLINGENIRAEKNEHENNIDQIFSEMSIF